MKKYYKKCTECGKEYFLKNKPTTKLCSSCASKRNNSIKGENHYRWNPNKSAFQMYRNECARITEETYKKHKSIINPDNHKRCVTGTPGGYQLDHIVSVQIGFDLNLDPEYIGSLENLQMLTWEENLSKGG